MANYKLSNDYWETSGVYDITQRKTQREINAVVAANTGANDPAVSDKTATGSIATFDGTGVPLKNLTVNLEPVQSGSGDPSPDNVRAITGWTGCNIAHTGKNLMGGMDLANQVERYMPGATINTTDKYVSFNSGSAVVSGVGTIVGTGYFKENTQYTFIFTIYKTSGTGSNMRVYYTDGTYDAFPSVSAIETKETKVFVSDSGKTVSHVSKTNQSGYTRIYYDESGVFEGVLTADDFEAYQGTTSCFAFPSSKNLYDKSRVTNGVYINESGVIAVGSDSCISYFIPVVANETYTWSGVQEANSNNKRIHAYKDGVWQSQITMQAADTTGAFAITFQVPSGVNQIRVSEYNTDTNIQIELGSTATAYEEYTQYYGGTLNVTTGVLTVKRAFFSLTGNESITLGTKSSSNDRRFLFRFSTAGYPSYKTGDFVPISSHMKLASSQASAVFGEFSITTDSYIKFFDGESRFTDVDAFKAWLTEQYTNGTPVQFCYNRQYKQEYQLTPTEVRTLLGINNIWADTGNVSVEYGAYFTIIENQLSDVENQLTEKIPKVAVAPIEQTTTASKAYAINEIFFMGDKLYIATASIASGATFTVGTNCAETTLGEQITALLNA